MGAAFTKNMRQTRAFTRVPNLINLIFKFMKELSSIIGFLVLVLVLRWAMPPEASALAGEILVKILTILRDLIMQVQT